MPPEILIPLILFIAFLVQSMIGFGSALTAIPFIAPIMTLRYATPTFVIVAFVVELALVWIYRKEFQWEDVKRIAFTMILGIPVGIALVRVVEGELLLTILGVFVICYVLYAFFAPNLPKLDNPRWGYLVGITSGILSGAYSTAGPPFVIYGTASRWTPEQFKGNLQSLFMIGSVVAVVSHMVGGNMTEDVLRLSFLAIPTSLLAVYVGTRLSPMIPTERFRQLVLIVLLISGLRLLM